MSHEGQVARAVAHADAEDGTVLGAVVLLQVGDGVRLVEPGGEDGEGVAAGGGQAMAAREPVAVGCAVGAEDDAAVVDDGVVGEGEGDAAVGVVVARGGGDDAGVRLPVREQGLLYGRGV